jgi:hypothetical protein
VILGNAHDRHRRPIGIGDFDGRSRRERHSGHAHLSAWRDMGHFAGALQVEQDRKEDVMRIQRYFVATVVTLLAALAPAGALAQEQTIKPSKNLITGLVDGAEEEKLRPPSGFIANQQDFDKLWQAWLLEDKAPQVDFKTSLIVVAASREGPIKKAVLIAEKNTGDMRIKVQIERKTDSRGLHVLIAVFPRAGIKTIEGKAIADK